MAEIDRHLAALQKAKAAGDEGAVQVIQGRIMAEQQKQRDATATKGMTTEELTAAGIGAGMSNIWENVKDIATSAASAGLPDQTRGPKWLAGPTAAEAEQAGTILGRAPTAEERAEEADVNRALLATPHGRAGKLVGEIGATLPVGMGVGAGMRTVAQGAGKMLPMAAARLARPLGQAMGQGASVGAVQAEPGERAEGAAIGAAGGALLRGAGKLAGKGIKGLVELTPAAKYLASKGIPLTVGQSAPASAAAQFEEAGVNIGGIGPVLARQRQEGLTAFQRAVLQEGAPAGAQIPKGLPIQDQLAATYKAFDAAYAPVKAIPIYPAIHAGGAGSMPLQGAQGAFRKAVMDPKAMATAETAQAVDRFLQNELSILGAPAKGALPRVEAGALIKIRSNIREALNQAAKRQDFAAERLLSNAEKAVTDTLETQLPAQASKYLRAVDAKYAKHMVGTEAVRKAGDVPTGFTPYQLQAALQKSMEGGRFARGGGGELRKLSKAGREVFDMRTPKTGAILGTVGSMPPFSLLTGPAMAVANQPGMKALLTGQTSAQLRSQAALEAIRRMLGERGVNAVKSLGTTSMSAALQED